MANVGKVVVILIGLFVALLLIAFIVGSAINLLVPPSQALYSDKIVEDIGGDNALVATLKGCAQINRKDISDGNFKTDLNFNLGWKNAKNRDIDIPTADNILNDANTSTNENKYRKLCT